MRTVKITDLNSPDEQNGAYIKAYLREGVTVLVGCNGWGKSHFLADVYHQAIRDSIVIDYNETIDGRSNFATKVMDFPNTISSSVDIREWALSSEGERLYMAFTDEASKIGRATHTAERENKDLYILLDALDSGTSIDRQKEMSEFFDFVCMDARNKGIKCYLLVAANSWEFVQGHRCLNARTGEEINFACYDDYSKWVCDRASELQEFWKLRNAESRVRA